jgi:hypothetical protein
MMSAIEVLWNPSSAKRLAAAEMISARRPAPSSWGQVAAAVALAFFDGHGVAKPVIVLAGWLVAGLLLCAAGSRRAARRSAPTAVESPTAADVPPAELAPADLAHSAAARG